MKNLDKIVDTFPLKQLWTDSEEICSRKLGYLSVKDIVEILKRKPVKFVLADTGKKLEWIEENQSFNYWKTKIKNNIAEYPDLINLGNFPNEYAYLASEWISGDETTIILVEKLH